MIRVSYNDSVYTELSNPKLITINGDAVELISNNLKNDYPILGIIKSGDKEFPCSWDKEGITSEDRILFLEDDNTINDNLFPNKLCIELNSLEFYNYYKKLLDGNYYCNLIIYDNNSITLKGTGKISNVLSNEIIFEYIIYNDNSSILENYKLSYDSLFYLNIINNKYIIYSISYNYGLLKKKKLTDSERNPKLFDIRSMGTRQGLTIEEMLKLNDLGMVLRGGRSSFINRKIGGRYKTITFSYTDKKPEDLPSLGVTDILGFLPNKIKDSYLILNFDKKLIGYFNDKDYLISYSFKDKELILSLYDLLIWYLKSI